MPQSNMQACWSFESSMLSTICGWSAIWKTCCAKSCSWSTALGVHYTDWSSTWLCPWHTSDNSSRVTLLLRRSKSWCFQVRAKYMALEPSKNRYVKYMRAIRTIQEYLVARAQRHAVPSVNNTNVDRSVATIHATVIGCLRRQARVSHPVNPPSHHPPCAVSPVPFPPSHPLTLCVYEGLPCKRCARPPVQFRHAPRLVFFPSMHKQGSEAYISVAVVSFVTSGSVGHPQHRRKCPIRSYM